MRLYRGVSPAEWTDIQANGFRPGPPSFQGKWFAESEADARTWGARMYQGSPFEVIEVDVPDELAGRLYQDPFLDRIGPARFADIEQLPELNRRMTGPRLVP